MKKKLDALYKAFESYIKGQPHFDILYSEKYGYVWISFDSGVMEMLDTPERMLERLCYDLINDVVFSPDNLMVHDDFILTEYEKTEVCRRLAEILKVIEGKEKDYYLGKIYGYFIKYQRPEWLDERRK